jgi:methionyl aminopeptidase
MIIYKSAEEIRAMRAANKIVAEVLTELKSLIMPGVTTNQLDSFAERMAKEKGAKPAFKGYRGYPASLCTSINEEIVHGIPSDRHLQDGDIISLDFGVILDGYYGDAAVTYPVGNIEPQAEKIIKVVEESLYKGLEQVKEGNRISDISAAVQEYVEANGFSVIRNFVGHGIGFSLHEEPGMALAIEPMIAAGDWNVDILADDWTAVTRDGSLSAHYEHTVAVTKRGMEILSLNKKKSELAQIEEKKHA